MVATDTSAAVRRMGVFLMIVRQPGVPAHRRGPVHRHRPAPLVRSRRPHDRRGEHGRRAQRGAADRDRPAGEPPGHRLRPVRFVPVGRRRAQPAARRRHKGFNAGKRRAPPATVQPDALTTQRAKYLDGTRPAAGSRGRDAPLGRGEAIAARPRRPGPHQGAPQRRVVSRCLTGRSPPPARGGPPNRHLQPASSRGRGGWHQTPGKPCLPSLRLSLPLCAA